jgi:glucans biosynthesis protein C
MQNTTRQTYLDWLRIIAIVGVLLFHATSPFAEYYDWHVNNAANSPLLSEFAFWLSGFRMHLLFFISGTVSWFMASKRTAGGFIGLRFRRLFIPLLAGMLLVIPPQVYMERLNQGYKGSFLDFYPSVFNFRPYPAGNFSWHHLWFIAYLFIYDVVLAPFFAWAVSPGAKNFVNRLAFFAAGKRIYLLMLPSVIWFSLTVLRFPQDQRVVGDYCFLLYWALFLLAGFICILQPALMDSLERNRRFSLSMAFLCTLIITALRWNKFDLEVYLPDWETSWITPFFVARRALNAWFWVFALVGYGKKYLHKRPAYMDYVNQAIYPFYIVHQTVMVVIAYYVVKTEETIGMKYLFIVITTLTISMGFYHLFIRPFAITRFLFGMKSSSKKSPLRESAAIPAISLKQGIELAGA